MKPRWWGMVDGFHRNRVHDHVQTSMRPYDFNDLIFYAVSMGGKSGEVLNVVKKAMRRDYREHNEFRKIVAGELADVRVYLELLAEACGVDLDDAVETKMEEAASRPRRTP